MRKGGQLENVKKGAAAHIAQSHQNVQNAINISNKSLFCQICIATTEYDKDRKWNT